MSTSEPSQLNTGRTNQKLRTRSELLKAAHTLMNRGELVTVAAAAREAAISVATAYRYFSDPDTLMAEALLDFDLAPSGDVVAELASQLAGIDDIEQRVLTVNRVLFAFTRRNEPAYRLFLAKSLEQVVKASRTGKSITTRGGRRIPMFEMALAPVRDRFPPSSFSDLVHRLSAACGLETFLVLKDVCQLSDTEADRLAEDNLRAILRAACVENEVTAAT